jgi:dTDP-4-dehydrorhamnose 3,5-epimerase-like enzyme
MPPTIHITEIPDSGDQRGENLSMPWELLGFLRGPIQDTHLSTVRQGCIRGNHAHAHKHEVTIARFHGPWELAWDEGGGSSRIHTHRFSGSGCVFLRIEPFCTHAVKNLHSKELLLVSMADQPWNQQNPDHLPRIILT